jgi:hypothetical protein
VPVLLDILPLFLVKASAMRHFSDFIFLDSRDYSGITDSGNKPTLQRTSSNGMFEACFSKAYNSVHPPGLTRATAKT